MASPAVRTAPAVNGSPNEVLTTMHMIDASGDTFTEAIKTTSAPLDADIEAWVAAYQGATQASVYKVTVSMGYVGDADPDNADTNSRNSVKQGVNTLYKNLTTLQTTSPRLVAPIEAVMQGNQDIPLLTATEFTALLTAQGTILTGYNLVSAQYTERRERSNNPRIKA